jgi:hypothetical protein
LREIETSMAALLLRSATLKRKSIEWSSRVRQLARPAAGVSEQAGSRRVVLTASPRADIFEILAWSRARFGALAGRHYRELVGALV